MSAGFGIAPFGLGLFGYVTPPPPMGITTAYAVSNRVVRVVLTTSPLHQSATGTGDAINPKTWAITVPTTGRILTPMAVTVVDSLTYDILTLQIFERPTVSMQVSTTTLVDPGGVPFPALTQDFLGSYQASTATNDKRASSAGYAIKDLTNLPTGFEDLIGGTLQINAGGDYTTMSGPDLLKKLIIRRIISKPGDFFHIPTYGIGLREKEPLPNVDLRKLAKAIEQQVLLEPEVAEVKANLAYAAAANTLNIVLKVRMRSTGQQLQVAVAVPTGAVQV